MTKHTKSLPKKILGFVPLFFGGKSAACIYLFIYIKNWKFTQSDFKLEV